MMPTPMPAAQEPGHNGSRESTGPRMLAGKVRASRNGLKHGRYAEKYDAQSLRKAMMELCEKPGEFRRMLQALFKAGERQRSEEPSPETS